MAQTKVATRQLPAMVGDSGSGGSAGLVPAPAAGDAAAGKFLKADGTFATPSVAAGSVAWGSVTGTLSAQTDVYNEIQGSVASNSTATYNDTVTHGSKTVLHDATAANITHNLPAAASNKAQITIKKIDSSTHTITVDANGTETIDGGLTAVLQAQYASITLVSDGTNWVII